MDTQIKTGNKRRRLAVRIIAIVLGVLVFFAALAVVIPMGLVKYMSTKHVGYRGEATEQYPMQDIYTPEEFALTAEEHMLTTADGIDVFVSEVRAEDPRAAVILLSGMEQPSVTYFYPQAAWLADEGISSFLLELRGHGRSGGDGLCFGYLEAADVAAVTDYIKSVPEYKDVSVVVQGVSMGGATAINAFGSNADIDGLIAMSAYSSFEEVSWSMMRKYGAPGILEGLAKSIMHMALKTEFGDAVDAMRPDVQIANADGRPVLLIASAGDASVPPDNTVRLAAAAGGKADIWVRPGDAHFIILDNDFKAVREDTEYCERILGFFEGLEKAA